MGSPTDIRKGKVIIYQNRPQLVLDSQHRTQGRQAGFTQVTLRDIQSGSSSTVKIRSTESVEFCHTESLNLEYSYVDDMGYHFMNPETFEDIVLPLNLLEDSKQFLVGNNTYSVLLVKDKPIQIQLPAAVEMKVVDAPEGIRGDSATNVMKAVTTESGLVLQAPLFIKTGEIIRVSTEDSSYLGRA
jgi:elongation factor P